MASNPSFPSSRVVIQLTKTPHKKRSFTNMDTYGSYIWQTFSPPTGQAWSTKGLFLISAKITTWWFKHRGKMWQAIVLMYLSWFLGGRLLRNWNWRRHTKVAGNRKPDKTILNLTFFWSVHLKHLPAVFFVKSNYIMHHPFMLPKRCRITPSHCFSSPQFHPQRNGFQKNMHLNLDHFPIPSSKPPPTLPSNYHIAWKYAPSQKESVYFPSIHFHRD